jgi:hypothetical protein
MSRVASLHVLLVVTVRFTACREVTLCDIIEVHGRFRLKTLPPSSVTVSNQNKEHAWKQALRLLFVAWWAYSSILRTEGVLSLGDIGEFPPGYNVTQNRVTDNPSIAIAEFCSICLSSACKGPTDYESLTFLPEDWNRPSCRSSRSFERGVILYHLYMSELTAFSP